MRLFGFELRISRIAARGSPVRGTGGWWPVVRDSFPGAWQANQEITVDTVLSYSAVFACTTLIASDIGKVRLRLVEQDEDQIWAEVERASPFWPVLRKPNRYQTIAKFLETWIVSKLNHGNTYVLKGRDDRGIVRAMYVLDPTRITPLVTPGGDVFYQLSRDDLAQVPNDPIAVPASEVIHDLAVPLFHPLIGVSPIYACGLAALQGLKIQNQSTAFFAAGSAPGGVLSAPGEIDEATAKRVKDYWDNNFSGDNVGKVAVLGSGLKYEPMTVNAVDAQLIEQLKYSVETVCSCYHVPAALIDSSHNPPYANLEPLVQQYYSQCLQSHMNGIELALDEGLELDNVPGKTIGTEFDIDDLIWMDTATKTKAAGDSIGSGGMSPNEARKKYYALGPVKGGDTPYLQQQMFSLEALAARDADQPFAKPAAPPPADQIPPDQLAGKAGALLQEVIAA